jgi:spore germination protein (amino acid permease)
MVGSSILNLPRLAADEAGQDAWIIIIIGALPPFIILLSTTFLFRRFPGHTFSQICSSILGKFLGKIPLLLYAIYGIFFCSVLVRSFSNILDTYVLPNTQQYIKILLMLITVVYMVLSGVKVIARFNELTFYLFLPLFFLLLPALREAQWTFILPIATTPITKLLSGSMVTSMAYTGMEYLFILYPFVHNKKKAAKDSILALVIVIAIYLYTTVIGIVVFGQYAIKHHIWPVLVLLKITNVPVLERLEFLFILIYIGVLLRPIMNQAFASSYFTSQLLGVKEFRMTAVPITVIIFILALIPPDVPSTFRYSDYIGIMGMLIGIGFPVILSLLSIIFKKGADMNDRS